MRDLLQRARLDDTPEVAEARLRSQLDLAVEALEDPLVWQAVEIVAQAVLERGPLTGPEIEALVKPDLEPDAAASDSA